MVTIVAGNGLGLLNTSLNTVGPAGMLEQSVFGQGSSRATVNVVNGNLVLQTQDAQLAGRGMDLFALRTYNSLGAPTDVDGDGWRWNYEQTVRFQGPGAPAQPGPGATVVRTDGDGHETTYTWDAARAAYVGTEGSGAHDELKYDGAATEWVWTDGSTRVTEGYSDSTVPTMTGRLVRRTDSTNNSIALAYDAGWLTVIKDTASQQELRLTYGLFSGLTRLERLEARPLIDDANGHATATLGDPLRLAEYDYDGQGRLTAITRYLTPTGGNAPSGPGFITNYSYEDSSTRIASVTHSDGTRVSFTYDSAGKVKAVKDHGGASAAQLTFDYGPQPNSTAITDGNGQVWAYRHDGVAGYLTEVLTPPVGGTGLSTRFRYDAEGNLTGITEPSNNAVTYGYNNGGNRALDRDALGNTTTRTFSSYNQVLTETRYRIADPDGAGPQGPGDPATTRYVYDANARLRFVVSAEGRVTENRYRSPNAGYGLLTETVLYVGQLYDVTALGPTEQLTETDLTNWVAGLPDRTQVQLTEYRYDLRGNMSQQTSYATVSAGGAGVLDAQASIAEYVHDAYSLLRQRMAVRGSARDRRAIVASLAYDGITRVVESRGANGLQMTVYDDTNGRVTVTAATGLTETREYDNRGRLVSVSQTGDGTTRQTRSVYDSADRLRMVEDAQGGRRYRFYDAAGRLEFKVDATGAVTRFEHNAAGQMVRQTQYVNRVNTDSWYDGATNTVTKSDLAVGGAGSDVPVDAAHDRVTTFEYDEAGRLTVSTDAVNTVTTVSYDGLSRVIMTQTGDRVTRYLYDKDNRRVGIVDALGYFTEYKYDAGGRLVETVRYSQRSPAAVNMTAPVWIGVTQQTVVAGRPFEYRVPAYDADGDPLTFSVVGAAPDWLSFDAGTATLRGTPPATVTSDSVTLRADDGRGKTSDVTVLFIVNAVAPSAGGEDAGPPWVPLSPLDIVANTPVSYVVPAAGGQSLTYRVVGGLPSGLFFDPTTLTITGSSSAAGFYTILLRATDATGKSADRTVSVRIRAAASTPAQPAGSNQPSAWRPANTSGLRSYLYYDGQGRVVGAVDEQQFLTETVYDDALNTQRTLRYLRPVTVAADDSLASLKSRAGASHQISLVQYDDFGRVREVTGPDGSTVTRNDYDEAGRLTRVVSAADTSEQRARRTFYNAFSEVTATLGGEGDAWLGTNPTPQRIREAIRDYGIRYEYDTLGRTIRSVDANGNKTLFYYDRENRRTHTVHVIGQSADNTLAGEVSETTYNSFGQPESVRRYAERIADPDMDQLLADGGGGLADQSLLGKLAVIADPSLDHLTLYEYDRCGRVVKQVDGENGVTENIYNAYGELAAQVRFTLEGQTTTKQFDYDVNGRVASQTDDVGRINANTRTEYDAFGRVIRSVDGVGHTTTTAYQDSGRSIAVTDPLQRTTRTDYDALGRMSRVTNALGHQTVYAYDETARSVRATTPEGIQVTTARTRHGETLSVTDARGNVTRYAYNKDGQPTTVTDALGRPIAHTTYHKSGRTLEVTDARGTVRRFAYDQRNRVVEQRVDPAGLNLTTVSEFDALDQQITVTEAAGTVAERTTTYAYDRKGRTKTVILDGAFGGAKLCTTYGYDGLDDAITVAHGTVANPDQHVTLHEFDGLSRRVKEIAAPASVFGAGPPGTRDLATQYRYDATGRLTRRIDANGHSAWYVYDAAGQLSRSIGALGEVGESRYDAAGRLIYSHRHLNRLPAGTVAVFGDVVPALAVPPAASPNDRRSHVLYDADGRTRFTLTATGANGWAIGENRYDAGGNVTEVRGYDRFLPNERVAARDSAGSPGITLSEIHDELRNTLGYRDDDPATLTGVQRTFFTYDANNRLRFTVDPSGSITESVHDATGNVVGTLRFAARPTIVQHTEAAIDAAVDRDDLDNQVKRYAYDATNRLRYTVDALNSVSETEYDARGNIVTAVRWATRPALTQHTESAIAAALAALPAAETDEVTRLVYDACDRLRFTIDALGSVSENAYDAVGNVVGATRFAARPTAGLEPFTEAAIAAAVAPLRTDPDNQVTRFAYDAQKRLRFAVDTLGSVTENVYDANGSVLATTRFAICPTLGQYDEAAIAAAVAPLRADPRNRLTRFAYDAQNRLRFTVDALGSVSERVYDALGNLTGTERFAVRPSLTQYAESAIDAAVATERGNPGNRLQHHLCDALGRVRYSVLRLSLAGGQPSYQVSGQEHNALGQTVRSTSYAAAVPLGALSEVAIVATVGGGDPSRDRVSHFVYDLASRQTYQLQAVTAEAGQRKYRVSAQRHDALGRVVGTTDYATAVALDAFDEVSIDAAVQAVADQARDRATAIAYDALGQAIYSVRMLGPGSHQVVRQEHDALGRVFRRTQYANAVGPLASFDRATIAAAMNAVAGPDDRKVQYVHDARGHERFVLQTDQSGHWTIGERRYDAIGNVVESRRYERYVTDGWIATVDAMRPAGASEHDVLEQLASLGYSDSAPTTLAGIQRSRLAYDMQNRLRFTIDALGSVVENVYDTFGDLTATVPFAARPALAQFIERAIDAAVDRTDANNQVDRYAYDATGGLRFTVQVVEPNVGSGGKHRISERRYDALGQLVERRAYATTVSHLSAYDEPTLAASVVADAGNDRRSALAYDAGGRQAFAGRRIGRGILHGAWVDDIYALTKQVHDALGQLVQRVDYASLQAPAQFDIVSVEGAQVPDPLNDRTTTYVHDAAGRLRFEIKPDLSFRESEYDALDQVTQTKQFNFRLSDNTPRTEPEMVALRGDRVVGIGRTRGQVHTYDAAGRLTRTIDANYNNEQYEYDALGGRTRWIDKKGNNWTCGYDRKGRKIRESTPPIAFKLRGEALATPAPDRALETRFVYDAFDNLIRKIEAANFPDDAATTEYLFDTVGRPTGTYHTGFYDPATGKVERDPGGNRFKQEASISYDAMGNVVRIGNRTGPDAFEHAYRTYDNQGQVVHEINALNHVTRYTYTSFGEQETVTRHSVTIAGTPQNAMYWTVGEIDPQLNWGRDENGNLMEDADARTIRLAYDQLGRKNVVTQPPLHYYSIYSTRTPGDASQANPFRPNPASVVGTPDATVTRYGYNAFGDTTWQGVRANNIVEWQETSFSYDAMGRRTRSVDAAGNITAMSYDPLGNLVRQEEPSGPTNVPSHTDRISEFDYNDLDQQTSVYRHGLRYTDANGADHGMAHWTWEHGGHWVDPEADLPTTVSTTHYDGYDRPLVVTDAAGNVTSMRYNALGQLVQVIAPARLVAPLAANGDGAVDPFRDQLSESLVTSMTLDAFGRVVRQVRATSQGGDARETLQSYDAAGNLVATTDAEGNVKERACDPAGRVIRETQAIHADLGPLGINGEGLERRYVYDALGQLTDTLDVYVDGIDLVQSGKSVVYNAFGEVVEERRKWGPANQTPGTLNTALVAYCYYDNAGRVINKVAADGLTVYKYNLLGQMTREEKRGRAIGPYEGPRITEIEYDVLGRPTMTRRPAFSADINAETGTTFRLVTPYTSHMHDRWGNVTSSQEGGYEFVDGAPSFAPHRIFRSYGYDDNNLLVSENRGTHGFVSSSGVTRNALISTVMFRDLLGNVVKEIDQAHEPQSEALINSRTRRRRYNSIGQLLDEIDATNRTVEYVYNIHGERLGTRNARGTVIFDRRDRNGNVRLHGVLRTADPASPAGVGEYNSHAGTGPIVRTYLNAYLHDQANRRFASKTFTDGADAPWSYTWLDGRNFGIQQRDAMGVLTRCRYDEFGNKAVQIDGAGVRTEWTAATADYDAGRIETYILPADSFMRFGRYTYNRFGELKRNDLGNARTEYTRNDNGLVDTVNIMPNVTEPNVFEITTYRYDARGQVTYESRSESDSFQAISISYDIQGRLARVRDDNRAPSCDVRYSYDEWSNVRRIQATYQQTWAGEPRTRNSWYDYDPAGRMTVSNGELSSGTIRPQRYTPGSVGIRYDTVGRRSGITEYLSHDTASVPTWRNWDTMRDESYENDDLGHLRLINQRIRHVNIVDEEGESKPDQVGSWQMLSSRAVNLRGDVTRLEQWTRIWGTLNSLLGTQFAALLGTTTTTYPADGQVSWTKTDAVDPKNSTETQFTYNAQTGQLESYVFNAFRSDGVPFAATFEYRHTFQNGARVVQRIRDTHNGLDTTKTYDPLGRLSSERVDLQKPNGPGSDRYEKRVYDYSADGRIIFKDAEWRLSDNGPGTVQLLPPTTGQQTYVYAGDRTVATVGAERLAGATRFDFAYAPMSDAAGSGTSRYVVQSGNSLIDIAQASYGDGALWYVVADANGSAAEPGEPLPSTEIGKAYEIPGVIPSSHNASTIKPYDMAEIIGNDRPIAIPPPPPPKYSDIELMAVAAARIVIQVGATAGLSALGVPVPVSAAIGAALGDFAGQATASWGLDMQAPGKDGIDWGGVRIAAMEGYMFSFGPVGPLAREFWQQGKNGFEGWTSGPGLNWTGIAGSVFNLGFDALGPVLGGPTFGPQRDGQRPFNFGLGALINSAYNPSSGWAIPASGRSPTVGAFEYAFSAVANGLGRMGYTWIRDQIERPSPPAPRPRSVDAPKRPVALAAKFLGAASGAPTVADIARDEWLGMESHFGPELLHVSDSVELDGLFMQRGVGVYDPWEGGFYDWQGQFHPGRQSALDAVAEMHSKFREEAFDPDVFWAPGSLVQIEDTLTPAAVTRWGWGPHWGRGDLSGVQNFSEFRETYARKHGRTAGVEKAFVEYHVGKIPDIVASWKRYDNALAAGNLVALPAVTAVGLTLAPSVTLSLVAPLIAEGATYKTLTWIGVDEVYADWLSRPAGFLAGYGTGYALGGWTGVGIMATGDVAGWGTTETLRRFGVPDDTARVFGGIAGLATGLGMFQLLPTGGPPSVGDLLKTQRAGRAPSDAARLAASAAEWEMSRGIQIREGVTLFKRMTAEARAARSANYAAPLLDAPTPPALAVAGDVPMSGGVRAVAGLDYYAPGAVRSIVPYEATAARRMADALQIGGFEPRSRLVANMSDGGSGFTGGTIGAAAPSARAMPDSFGITRDLTGIRGNLFPEYLRTAISRSGAQNFAFKSIAQDAEQLAQWNRGLRTVAARPESTYATTLGQQLTSADARLAFSEVNAEFLKLRGIAGAGTHNVHHWNALARFSELSLDPRNLYLVESAVEEGRRVGEHIFLHWASRSGNPYSGAVRPGAVHDLGWPRSVLEALE